MKKIYPAFFVAVVFSFSAIMLIVSLLCSIKLSAVNDACGRIDGKISRLEEENQRLSAEYESFISIEELERYALDELGMQHITAVQIEYLELG